MGRPSKRTCGYAERKKKKKKQRSKVPCLFLVVEGKSEKIYFENFSSRNCQVKVFVAPSGDPVGLVKKAENLKKRGTIDLDDLDKMWCVFDRDDNNPENIEKALIRAEKNGFKIAFSNPCFEIWLLWHFEETFAYVEISQKLAEKLKPHLGDYCKTKDYFDCLQPRMNDTISRAKKAEKMHVQNGRKKFTREFNPSSNIYEIVEEIQNLQAVDRS